MARWADGLPTSSLTDVSKYVPLYVRMELDLRERIASGQLFPGAPVPSEAELARQYATSRVTVRQALARLRYDGVLESRRGLGTFVARPAVVHPLNTSRSFEERMQAEGIQVDHKLLRFTRVMPSAETRERLRIAASTPVYLLERLRIVGGKLIGLECHYVPIAIGAKIDREQAGTQPVLDLAESIHGQRARRMQISIRAAGATASEARKLGLRVGAPVVVRRHAYVTDRGDTILCGRNVFTEHYEAIVELEDRDGVILARQWYPTLRQ